MATREDYRVLHSNVYFDLHDLLENAKSEEDFRTGLKKLKVKLAAAMSDKDLEWIEKNIQSLKL